MVPQLVQPLPRRPHRKAIRGLQRAELHVTLWRLEAPGLLVPTLPPTSRWLPRKVVSPFVGRCQGRIAQQTHHPYCARPPPSSAPGIPCASDQLTCVVGSDPCGQLTGGGGTGSRVVYTPPPHTTSLGIGRGSHHSYHESRFTLRCKTLHAI